MYDEQQSDRYGIVVGGGGDSEKCIVKAIDRGSSRREEQESSSKLWLMRIYLQFVVGVGVFKKGGEEGGELFW